MMLSLPGDASAATCGIHPYLRPEAATEPLWLKCEFLQHTASSRHVGPFNRLLAARYRGELDPSAGVVVASGGNAGLANAYAAAALGVRATVFVPETAPLVKVDRIREYGADVRQLGTEYAEAHEAAIDYANTCGALLNQPTTSSKLRQVPALSPW